MKPQINDRGRKLSGKNGKANARRASRLESRVRREIDDIYRQLEAQLTRLAEIQVQFDDLRSKIRQL